MNIIREKSSNLVIYAGEVCLTKKGVIGRDFIDPTNRPDRVELIEVASLPAGFMGGKWTYTDGAWTGDSNYLAELAEQEIVGKKARIAAQRYVMETSGVQYNGRTILTDRESVQILDSAVEKIRRGIVPSTEWKCPDGYLTLTSANIDALELLVLSHVQAAFAWEKTELDKINHEVSQ